MPGDQGLFYSQQTVMHCRQARQGLIRLSYYVWISKIGLRHCLNSHRTVWHQDYMFAALGAQVNSGFARNTPPFLNPKAA